jgi:hypothetical protein
MPGPLMCVPKLASAPDCLLFASLPHTSHPPTPLADTGILILLMLCLRRSCACRTCNVIGPFPLCCPSLDCWTAGLPCSADQPAAGACPPSPSTPATRRAKVGPKAINNHHNKNTSFLAPAWRKQEPRPQGESAVACSWLMAGPHRPPPTLLARFLLDWTGLDACVGTLCIILL